MQPMSLAVTSAAFAPRRRIVPYSMVRVTLAAAVAMGSAPVDSRLLLRCPQVRRVVARLRRAQELLSSLEQIPHLGIRSEAQSSKHIADGVG